MFQLVTWLYTNYLFKNNNDSIRMAHSWDVLFLPSEIEKVIAQSISLSHKQNHMNQKR